jgi:Family of unknown function (DUF6932)
MIPELNESGHLPVGGHACTWEEFYLRFRCSERRQELCLALEPIIALARHCGFLRVMIGGSFPTSAASPRDIDLTWIAAENVSKDTVKPECVKLMDDKMAKDEYGWNMLFLPIDHDESKIQHWARQLGFCCKTNKDRGMLVIDL